MPGHHQALLPRFFVDEGRRPDRTRCPVPLPCPGPAFGAYPQRAPTPPSALETAWRRLRCTLDHRTQRASQRRLVARVRAAQAAWPAAGTAAESVARHRLRARLAREGFTEELLAPAFALVCRAVQAQEGLELFHTQLIAAHILLDNRLAEMATGEGKTHAMLLAAAVAALAGVPVHVITANPYLAARDAERLGPVYRALGLRVAAIRSDDDEDARRAVWQHDVVYCTASDVVFDYLRDQTDTPGARPRLRGLCMALIDEADSVLIDEALTPFILAESRADAAAAQRHRSALALASALREGEHFAVAGGTERHALTAHGRQACERAAGAFGSSDPFWAQRRHREELIELALRALHGQRRDVHYLVRDGKAGREVAIIDLTTGRVAEGRRWSNGLQQLVELKKGCVPSPLQVTRAQLTYQRFFPRYWRLGGMSGSLREAGAELLSVYGLAVQTVPLRAPLRRLHTPPQLYAGHERRWAAVVREIAAVRAAGRAVLVGTDSVRDALHLCELLRAAGISHQRLDARQDAAEAACIAVAGSASSVTVATNMAGRGTDIALQAGVRERGGLHVIACQQNASARIDRQLHGRAARAGDPGSVSTALALDDGLLARRLPPILRYALARLAGREAPLWAPLARIVLASVQFLEEGRTRRARVRLLDADKQLIASLGFGARTE